MFASHIIDSYVQEIMTVATEINALEQRLSELREQQAALETEKQAMQTLAAAGQSAIDQSRQFLTLARNSQEMIDAFWEKMENVKNEAVSVGELLPSNEDDGHQKMDDLSTHSVLDNDTIDVKARNDNEDNDTIETKTEQVIVNLTNGNGKSPHLTLLQLKTYTLLELRKIAGKVGVKTKQGKEAIAQDLEKKNLTQKDVDKVLK